MTTVTNLFLACTFFLIYSITAYIINKRIRLYVSQGMKKHRFDTILPASQILALYLALVSFLIAATATINGKHAILEEKTALILIAYALFFLMLISAAASQAQIKLLGHLSMSDEEQERVWYVQRVFSELQYLSVVVFCLTILKYIQTGYM